MSLCIYFFDINYYLQFSYQLTLMQQENQRHLSFNKFVEQRSVQIAKFLTDLELDTKKKGHQALPRSIRRRAMSHNRYRIPKKLRKNIDDNLAKAETMQKIPKCRKHIRKRRGLIMAYKLRSSKVQWLSTHLWSARRMRMVEYYGYKIAQTPNNKCFRSAYRHFRHNCCLLDLSYYNCLSLNFQSESLPASIKLKSNDKTTNFNQIYEIELYSSSTRERLICPAYLVRYHNQTYKLSLKIFFHPAAVAQVSKITFESKIVASLQHGQCDLYLLIGPESSNMLSSALQQYGILKKDQSLQFYDGSHKLAYLAKQQNFQIVNKPQVTCPIPLEKQIKKQYKSIQNVTLRQNMLKIYQNMLNERKQSKNINEKAHNMFWQYYEKGQNKQLEQTVFKITLRSRYTHKRNNKVSKAEKKKIVQAQRQSPSPKRRKMDNPMKDQNESSSSLNYSKQIFLQTPIHKNAVLEEIHPVIVGQAGEGLMKGFLIFASNANSCKLWRIMTHLNIKTIGRREYQHMHLQSNNLLFPQNYVQTKSFATYQGQTKAKMFKIHMRIPLHKQPHYYTLNSPLPFGFIPKEPMIISVEMIGKGKCFQMSYICEIQQADMTQIGNSLDNGKAGIIFSEQLPQKANERKRYTVIQEIESDLRLCEPARRIIGQITTGGYLFSRSREGGVGFIDKPLMSQSYLQRFGGYVFVRKTTSRHYMLASITNHFT